MKHLRSKSISQHLGRWPWLVTDFEQQRCWIVWLIYLAVVCHFINAQCNRNLYLPRCIIEKIIHQSLRCVLVLIPFYSLTGPSSRPKLNVYLTRKVPFWVHSERDTERIADHLSDIVNDICYALTDDTSVQQVTLERAPRNLLITDPTNLMTLSKYYVEGQIALWSELMGLKARSVWRAYICLSFLLFFRHV